MTEAKQILKKYYGYDKFRDGQEEIIDKIMQKQDVLGIMPTGAGKSICYQIPAILLRGITIVISPLISLMKDQVDSFAQLGVNVTFINSSLSYIQYQNVINNTKKGMYKIIYIAPERLDSEGFIDLIKDLEISMIAVDEAHCVSQWGHDFRVSYKKIANVIEKIEKRPTVVAFTATATPIVKEDIVKLLKLEKPYIVTTGFDRKNLEFKIAKPNKKLEYLTKYLNEKSGKSGVIYCNTRKNVDMLTTKLNEMGIDCVRYHAGLGEKEKTKNQEDFIHDRHQIMIATNAFGMGIDKPTIRFVVHYNMPKDMESYYQEAGRAGRDGDYAECTLMFHSSDIITNKFIIEQSEEIANKETLYEKLNEVVNYCNTEKCLRQYILQYFGEDTKIDNCENCSNCKNEFEAKDITLEAQKILSCIKRMDERFGSGLVTDVLKGSKSKKIIQLGFGNLTTYGIMKEYSKESIKEVISYLIAEQYLRLSGNEYPILQLNQKSYEILKGECKIEVRLEMKKEEKSIKEKGNIEDFDINLFEILRELRKELAREQNVPPYIIFGDVSLKEMSKYYPNTEDKFLDINGVGRNKLEKYGDIFVKEIQKYRIENDIRD